MRKTHAILSDCLETTETVIINGVEVLATATKSFHGGGTSTSIRHSSFVTRRSTFTDYDAYGRRIAGDPVRTNSLAVVREQLTGLSDACRRHVVEMVGRGVPDAPLSVTETTVSYDPDTDIETETVTSSAAATVVRRYRHGVLLSTETNGETTAYEYDAFGRVAASCRGAGGQSAESIAVAAYDYAPCGDLMATHTFTNGADAVTETYAYDMLGNRVATTNALGDATFRAYDPLGRVIAEWGATYPILHTYDTQGRKEHNNQMKTIML